MLTLRQVTFSIDGRALLHQVDWTVMPGRRLALVGANGTGKTTLLRIMAAELEPDSGEVVKSRSYRVAHLPQETVAGGEGTLMQSVLNGRSDILRLEAQLEALRADPPPEDSDYSQWLKRVENLETRYSSKKGYELENRARRILSGLGFERAQEGLSLSSFSGGWRMRALLARLLLKEPDLLLLDEPTNHLDLPSLEWLERFILNFSGSMVMVSHDRFFIDRLSQEIVELENGCLHHYPGRYRTYLKMRAQQREHTTQLQRQQKVERRRQEKFIERFRYKATKAAQVQSRVKQLEKMEAAKPIPAPDPKINFRLTPAQASFRDVLSLKNMGFAYSPGQWVFRGIDLEVRRQDKICLVGRNGAGKTTLTRLINQELTPLEGTLTLGRRTVVGYYAQHQVEALNLDLPIIREVSDAAPPARIPEVRSILGLFGFHGNEVFKPIRVLSGGEKARVSLARILISGTNFLIMDEPTNHLDIHARDALEKALDAYEGTIMLVSHDRFFLDGIVTRVVEIQDGCLREYLGNYSEYLEKRDEPVDEPALPETMAGSGESRRNERQRQALARQAVSKERGRLSENIRTLEERIEILELRQAELESHLAHPETYDNSEKVVDLQKQYARVIEQVETAVSDWESLHHELDTLLENLSPASSGETNT
ncbi:MAG TPA: ATP-binding cassette domain-containing protein [Candidatus Aminicenantes bacterium]|nr:ATP-binding cassette domain-containing protein [Candidatus Aminicenantes bacterium]